MSTHSRFSRRCRSYLLQVSAISIFWNSAGQVHFSNYNYQAKTPKPLSSIHTAQIWKVRNARFKSRCFFLPGSNRAWYALWRNMDITFHLSVTSIYLEGTTFNMVPTQNGSELPAQYGTVGVPSSPQVQPRVVLSSYKHVTLVERRMMSYFHRYSTVSVTGKQRFIHLYFFFFPPAS